MTTYFSPMQNPSRGLPQHPQLPEESIDSLKDKLARLKEYRDQLAQIDAAARAEIQRVEEFQSPQRPVKERFQQWRMGFPKFAQQIPPGGERELPIFLESVSDRVVHRCTLLESHTQRMFEIPPAQQVWVGDRLTSNAPMGASSVKMDENLVGRAKSSTEALMKQMREHWCRGLDEVEKQVSLGKGASASSSRTDPALELEKDWLESAEKNFPSLRYLLSNDEFQAWIASLQRIVAWLHWSQSPTEVAANRYSIRSDPSSPSLIEIVENDNAAGRIQPASSSS
jgi:hypothetical protein